MTDTGKGRTGDLGVERYPVKQQLESHYPKLTTKERLLYLLLCNFRFGRKYLGGYWIKTKLGGVVKDGIWLLVTVEGYNAFRNMGDVVAVEVYN